MQSIMIATTNTQKTYPTFNYFPYLQNPIKIQLYQKLYRYFSKTWKEYTNISHIVQCVKCL